MNSMTAHTLPDLIRMRDRLREMRRHNQACRLSECPGCVNAKPYTYPACLACIEAEIERRELTKGPR